MLDKSFVYNILAEGMYFLDKSSPSNFSFLDFPLFFFLLPKNNKKADRFWMEIS